METQRLETLNYSIAKPASLQGERKAIYIYPVTKAMLHKENNVYVRRLLDNLNNDYKITNQATDIGLLDALKKFKQSDVFYLNWIEDVVDKRYGYLQVVLLPVLIILCKVFNKKIVWFIHNNISHYKTDFLIKKLIVKLMARSADLILSHSNEIKLKLPKEKLHVFHHPIDQYKPLPEIQPAEYDLLIWGSVSPYKGVAEFVEYASNSAGLTKLKILIAGRFDSAAYYGNVLNKKSSNISIINRFVEEEELTSLLSKSKYILFTYASESILSSAALSKSLIYGKDIIGPSIGSFKELGSMGLLHTYDSFSSLEELLAGLEKGEVKRIDRPHLKRYVEDTSWKNFSLFIQRNINELF